MIKRTFAALFVTVMALTLTHQSFAQVASLVAETSSDTWTLLGTKTVDYTLDRDVVILEKSDDSFESLKFIVKNGALNMHKCTVHFTNGDTQVVEFPSEVNYTNDGSILDLLGNTKSIEKVTFWYDSTNSSDTKSTIELWGK